jgi:hypothetical protein
MWIWWMFNVVCYNNVCLCYTIFKLGLVHFHILDGLTLLEDTHDPQFTIQGNCCKWLIVLVYLNFNGIVQIEFHYNLLYDRI